MAVNNAFETTIDNITNFDENIGFWENLKNNLFSELDNDKDWIKNAFGEIISKENIDSYISELDLKSAKNKLKEIFNWQKDINNGKATWNEYFAKYKDGEKYVVDLIKSTDDLSKLTENDLVQANKKARESVINHNNAIKQQTISAKSATIAMKALSVAGNMIAMWAVVKAISFTVEKIDTFVHSVEKAKETAKETIATINESNSSIQSNGKWIENNISRYEKLSKGIDALGRNVSLTDEEFKEYNSLTNEIAEMFPTLVTGYTGTGEAILSCKNNVDLLTQAYEEQKQAAQDAVLSQSNTLFKGFKAETTSANILNNNLSNIDEYDALQKLLTSKNVNDINDAELLSILNNVGLISNKYISKSRDELQKLVDQNISILSSYSRTLQTSMESATSNVTPIIDAYLDTNVDFNKYDVEIQSYIKQIADNMGYRFYSEFENESALVNWIEGILVPAFNDASSQKLLSDLFSIDKDSMSASQYINEVNHLIEQIAKKTGGDANQIKIQLGFDFVDTYEELVDGVKDKIIGSVNETSVGVTSAISKAMQQANNQVALDWVESLSEEELKLANSDEFERALLEQKEKLNGAALSANNYDKALQSAKKSLNNLNSDNETPDLWDYSETISQLDTIKEKFDVLDNAFAKLHDADKSTQIGFDDFSSINEAFKDLDGIDTYIQRLQEAGQNQEQVTSVMQDLISAYLDYSNVLDNITDENKDLVVSMLEELGVANALDVVNAKLSGSLFSVADAENLVVQYGYSLIQITTDEINGLVLEGAISEQTAQQLAILALQKQLTNDAKIETEEEVNRIYNLAKMAGIGAEALAKFAQFKNDLENTTDARTRSWIIKSINTYKSTLFKEIDGVKTNEDIFTPVKYTGGKATKSAASSAKKEAKKTMEDIQKDWKEYLDKYLALYKAELDAGLIDFQTFLNKSRSLLDEFYRDGKISAKDYWDSVGNLYQQQLDVYDKVISAITKRIDKEIEGIQGIIDGLEKQNDVLQNQLDEYDGILKVVDDVYQTEIDSIKQKQDAIDDTISKLQDENDEKQRAIDLEKARYQLYRALNNRNVKLYNGKEYIYTHDREEVRDAQQNLADLELQETVAGLEKEKNALDEVIAELEKYRDLWSEISSAKQNEEYKQLAIAIWGKDYEKLILSNRISDIESFKDNYIHIQQQIEDNQGLIDSYNEKIEYYDALKQAWNAIATEREETVNREMAAQVLGATWENDILNGRMEVLNNFRNQYLATQQAIVDAAWNAANAQIAALNAIKSAESTSSQTSSSSKAPTVSGNKNTPTKKPSKPSKPNANSGGGISNLPTIEKYGSGTDNAKPGWHEVAESGNEIIRDNNGNAYIAKGRQIHLFEGGETVYSASDTRELLSGSISPLDAGIGEVVVFDHDKMRKNLQQLIPDYMNTMPSMINIPRYNVDNVRSGNPININIGDINLHEVQSVDGLAKAIIRELPGKVNQAMYRK